MPAEEAAVPGGVVWSDEFWAEAALASLLRWYAEEASSEGVYPCWAEGLLRLSGWGFEAGWVWVVLELLLPLLEDIVLLLPLLMVFGVGLVLRDGRDGAEDEEGGDGGRRCCVVRIVTGPWGWHQTARAIRAFMARRT